MALAIDSTGCIYSTRANFTESSSLDIVTAKYNIDGTEQWVTHYNSADNLDDSPQCILVDNSGSVYIAGFSERYLTGDDFITIKYDSYGVEKWRRFYKHPSGNQRSIGNDLAIDATGSIYVIGKSNFNGYSTSEFTVIKYLANGYQKWINNFGFMASAWSIQLGNSGDVHVAGFLKLQMFLQVILSQ